MTAAKTTIDELIDKKNPKIQLSVYLASVSTPLESVVIHTQPKNN